MMIQIGDPAPDFTLTTLTAEGPDHVTLSDHFGKTTTLLLFVPMAFTSVCTGEFCQLSKELNEYSELKTAVYGISGDNPFAQQAWAKQEGILLTLLSDYDHRVAEAYGVAYETFLPKLKLCMGGVPKRSAFVVDQQGKVQYAEVLDDPSQLPNFEKIKAKLGELSP